MALIYLVRHGETSLNAAGDAFCGSSDVPLNDRGRQQAQRVGNALAHYSSSLKLVVHSGMNRAEETAQIISDALYKAQHCALPRFSETGFREVSFGDWEGKTKQEVRSQSPFDYAKWKDSPAQFRIPKGENFIIARQRISQAFERWTQRYAESDMVIVSHKTIIRLFITGILEAPADKYRCIDLDNSSLTILRRDSLAEPIRIVAVNQTLGGGQDE